MYVTWGVCVVEDGSTMPVAPDALMTRVTIAARRVNVRSRLLHISGSSGLSPCPCPCPCACSWTGLSSLLTAFEIPAPVLTAVLTLVTTGRSPELEIGVVSFTTSQSTVPFIPVPVTVSVATSPGIMVALYRNAATSALRTVRLGVPLCVLSVTKSRHADLISATPVTNTG